MKKLVYVSRFYGHNDTRRGTGNRAKNHGLFRRLQRAYRPKYWVVTKYLWGIALNLKVDDDNSDDNPADIEWYATVSKLPTWSYGFPANQHLTAQHNTKRKMLITDF